VGVAGAAADAGRLQAVARDGPSPWREAALFRLLRDHPGAAGQFLEQGPFSGDGSLVASLLTVQGKFDWADGAPRLLRDAPALEAVALFCESLPADPAALRSALRRVPPLAQRQFDPAAGGGRCLGAFQPPRYLALPPAGQLLGLLRTACRLHDPDDEDEVAGRGWVEFWTEVLDLAWLRDGDPGPLVKALEE